MIEAYAFLAAFTVQILVMSVLYPAWFIRYVRVQATSFPAERLAQLYPGVDLGHAQERFLTRYRALTTGIAVLGLLLLGWLFSYMRRPDWDEGPVEVLVTVYFLAAQMLPLVLVVWVGVRFNKEHKRSLPEGKRTGHPAAPRTVRFRLAVHRFPCRLELFPVRRVRDLYPTAPVSGICWPHQPRRHHAGLRSKCIRRVHDAVWQKEQSVRDARGSPAHDRSDSEEQRLLVHRHRRVPVAQLLARAAGSAEMGTVRAKYFFRHLRACSLPWASPRRCASQKWMGSAPTGD